jgi:diguanylate cyclase (GGDEF)-like protein
MKANPPSASRIKLPQITLGFVCIGVIGYLDILTGYELELSLFYLIPISLLTWFSNRETGIFGSLTGAIVWLYSNFASGHHYSRTVFYVWNTCIIFGFFVISSILLSALKNALIRERDLARKDTLTGALNSRSFLESLQMEIERSRRYVHPFTVVFIDLDNFKIVNDQQGHSTGDQVLRTVVTAIATHVRTTDTVARFGGDEFTLLLPETDQNSAHIILSNLQKALREAMSLNNWRITFSIGVVTCTCITQTAAEVVEMADDVMYSVKRARKDAVAYSIVNQQGIRTDTPP